MHPHMCPTTSSFWQLIRKCPLQPLPIPFLSGIHSPSTLSHPTSVVINDIVLWKSIISTPSFTPSSQLVSQLVRTTSTHCVPHCTSPRGVHSAPPPPSVCLCVSPEGGGQLKWKILTLSHTETSTLAVIGICTWLVLHHRGRHSTFLLWGTQIYV